MTRQAALGFDIGTTSVKAGLLWLDGDAPMSVIGRPYPSSRPQPGWVEQDPADWLDAMAACWAELRAAAGPLTLRAVGICSQVNSHVFVDADLSPLRPAITWQDTRAAAEAAELDARVDASRTELWGGPFTVDASFALSRAAWLERHEPELRQATRWLLLPKDYCIAALTGEVWSDAISPVGLVGEGEAYIPAVLALVEGADGLLPPLRSFDRQAGTTLPGNPAGLPAGVPVAVSTMDAWGSIFGAGLLRPGRGMDVAGTSEIVAVSSAASIPTQGIVSFPPVRGVHVHAGPTQAGGSALEWTAALLSVSLSEALVLADQAARDPQPMVFLPHLAGERAPYWNPDARGVFLGLTTSTEPGHLALAVLEGVAYAVRMLIELCEAAAGDSVETIRSCGGAARSTLWNRIKASTLGRPVEVLETLDAGVLGAALLGIVAASTDADLEALIEQHVRVSTRIEPEPGATARLDDLYGVYIEAYRALEPLFPKLAPPT